MIRLTIAIGNIPSSAEQALLPQQLADAFPDVEVYRALPRPNVVYANAMAWLAVLGVTADIAGIAGFIWMAWEKARASRPHVKTEGPDPLLLIQLNPGTRKFKQLVIRESELSKDAFVAQFAEAVRTLQSEDTDNDRNLSDNAGWVRIKRHKID